ncbi:hypothetical protein ACN4EG_24510 [Alkalinema pantanalense CENA528]|uniref:hypothetical protein n=1 Tax=Alkalinema pantanalense TaxID=1620705 RepID=UPI003D6FF045
MTSIKIHQRVGADGILHLDIPVGIVERDVEVIVTYQLVASPPVTGHVLKKFYGICADDPIILDEQGISDQLDDDLIGAFD